MATKPESRRKKAAADSPSKNEGRPPISWMADGLLLFLMQLHIKEGFSIKSASERVSEVLRRARIGAGDVKGKQRKHLFWTAGTVRRRYYKLIDPTSPEWRRLKPQIVVLPKY